MLVPLLKMPRYLPELTIWFRERPIEINFMHPTDFDAHETKIPIEEFDPDDPDHSFIREVRSIEVSLNCDFSEFMRRCRIKKHSVPDRFTIHGQSYLVLIENQPKYGESKVAWMFCRTSGELVTTKPEWGRAIMHIWANIAGISGLQMEEFPDLQQQKQGPFRRQIA
jgi:hypothetical protein